MRRLTAFLAAAGILSHGAQAAACGGFFCDQGGPGPGQVLQQASERIVFQVGDGRVRATVQVQYDGDPVDFAWVVPVPARPEIGVADPELFNALEAATAPTFVFPAGAMSARSAPAGCNEAGCVDGDGTFGGDGFQDTTVRILSSESVGPYQTTVVTAKEPADLTAWLASNVYVVPPESQPIIERYVEEGAFFVAVRLQASATVDLIQPLVVEYEGDEPCVPLRMTGLAAVPDMEVLVWIVSDAQASPVNFERTLVDDRDVLAEGSAAGYERLLPEAIDAAGGRAFVTELAKPTSELPDLSATSAEAEAILRSGAFLTRLRTRLDPEEMTLDPIFAFDPDLAEVDNVHDLSGAGVAGIRPHGDTRFAAFGSGASGLAVALVLLRRRR